MKSDSIVFPILYRMDDQLIASGVEIMKWAGFNHERENEFSYRESTKENHGRFHWLIDGNGQLREFKILGFQREWARWLKPIVVLTRVRCELQPGRRITVGELRDKITCLKSGRDFQHEKHLLSFLHGLSEKETFTRAMFLKFMGEPDSPNIATFP